MKLNYLLMLCLATFSLCPQSATGGVKVDQDSSRQDILFLSKLLDIGVTQDAKFVGIDVFDVLRNEQTTRSLLDRLAEIQGRAPGGISEAAKKLVAAIPVLGRVYVRFSAERLEQVPLAILFNKLGDQGLKRNLQYYEKISQEAAAAVVGHLADENTIVQPRPNLVVYATDDSVILSLQGERAFKDVFIKLTGSGIDGTECTVIAFRDRLSPSLNSRVPIWFGNRFDIGKIVNLEIQLFELDATHAAATVQLRDHLVRILSDSILKAKHQLDVDEFDQARESVRQLRVICQREQIDKFDDELSKIDELLAVGSSYLPEKSKILKELGRRPTFRGEFTKDGNTQKLSAKCLGVNARGQVQFSFRPTGRNSKSQTWIGQIDIDVENETLQLKLARAGSSMTLSLNGRKLVGETSDGESIVMVRR